jgi:hypothetical protein
MFKDKLQKDVEDKGLSGPVTEGSQHLSNQFTVLRNFSGIGGFLLEEKMHEVKVIIWISLQDSKLHGDGFES